MNYTLTVQYNKTSDEYYIILPPDLLKKMKWNTGDKIKWTQKKDSFILTKVK